MKLHKAVSYTHLDVYKRQEGTENAMWVLLDYVSVVVHVFQRSIREYYEIEELWGDAQITKIEN